MVLGGLLLVVAVLLSPDFALLLVDVRCPAEGEAVVPLLVLVDVLHALSGRIYAGRLADAVLQDVIDQEIIVFQGLILVDERNEVHVSSDVFHLDESQLDVRVKVILAHVRELSAIVTYVVMLLKLVVPDFVNLCFVYAIHRFEKINVVISRNYWPISLTLYDVAHLMG